MDLLAAQRFDDLLAELPQADAAAGQLGLGRDQAEDVALRRVAVPAEQQVGGAEVEEAQGVRLDDLAEVHQAAQLLGGRAECVDRQDAVAGLGRGDQVADRADAADAGA